MSLQDRGRVPLGRQDHLSFVQGCFFAFLETPPDRTPAGPAEVWSHLTTRETGTRPTPPLANCTPSPQTSPGRSGGRPPRASYEERRLRTGAEGMATQIPLYTVIVYIDLIIYQLGKFIGQALTDSEIHLCYEAHSLRLDFPSLIIVLLTKDIQK